MFRLHECTVCGLLDQDFGLKQCSYCPVCDAWLCVPDITNIARRAAAMYKRQRSNLNKWLEKLSRNKFMGGLGYDDGFSASDEFGLGYIPANPAGGGAPSQFTLVQHVANASCGASNTSCVLTVSPLGAGNVVIVGFAAAGAASKQITSVAGGGTFTHCTTCTGSNGGGAGATDISYTLNSTGGVTSITVNYNLAVNPFVAMIEYSYSGPSTSFDIGNSVNNTTNTLRGGVDLSALAGSNDVLYQIIAANTGITISAITSPYNGTIDSGAGRGFASAISVAGAPPTWTFSGNSQSSGSGIAIQGN